MLQIWQWWVCLSNHPSAIKQTFWTIKMKAWAVDLLHSRQRLFPLHDLITSRDRQPTGKTNWSDAKSFLRETELKPYISERPLEPFKEPRSLALAANSTFESHQLEKQIVGDSWSYQLLQGFPNCFHATHSSADDSGSSRLCHFHLILSFFFT